MVIEQRLKKLEQEAPQDQGFVPIWPDEDCTYTYDGKTPKWIVTKNVPLDAAHFEIAHVMLNTYHHRKKRQKSELHSPQEAEYVNHHT